MIGVIADPSDHGVVREFFELFKTPWEFYRRDRCYEVLLCAGGVQVVGDAKLVVLYAGRRVVFDEQQKIQIGRQNRESCMLTYQGSRMPIYGDAVTFRETNGILTDEESQQSAAYVCPSAKGVLARIGYDLFSEIRSLLSEGQPPANANIPTLELHIALLRSLITGCGLRLIEVPPVPDGYPFIACLTHDVDHPSIRQHKWDHTVLGFLFRAAFVSVVDVLRARIPFRALLINWLAVLKLPLVHLGIARDFWSEFDDCYLELEEGLGSTFFVIPFKNCPGQHAPRLRAARYDARDIAATLRKLLAAGCEVGLHGIDAWMDSSKGREELEEIRRLTGVSEIGVRMHWLYHDQQSAVILENAGAAYDSSISYNETVGYRTGTTQAYKPLQVSRLLELPLHVMDTALFYLSYLGLSPRQATARLDQLLNNAVRFGGCITVNWHDRSLAPERMWGETYRTLLQDLKNRGPWFATTGQAVAWFRKRRSVVFETDTQSEAVRARVTDNDWSGNREPLPDLRLRIHNADDLLAPEWHAFDGYADIAFNGSVERNIPCGVAF